MHTLFMHVMQMATANGRGGLRTLNGLVGGERGVVDTAGAGGRLAVGLGVAITVALLLAVLIVGLHMLGQVV